MNHDMATLNAWSQKEWLVDLAGILNKIPTPVICTPATGEIIFVNEFFKNAFGYTLADIPHVDEWWRKAYPDKEYRHRIRSIWQRELTQAAETGLLRQPVEGTVVCKNGTSKIVEAHLSTLMQGDQERLYVVSLLDVTTTKNIVEELRRERANVEAASTAKSTFFSNMTHELRTPLNAIIGFADLILHEVRGPIGNGYYKSYLEDILSSGRSLLEIINDLLDLSKLEAGKVTVNAERLNVRAISSECSRLVALTVEQKELTLTDETPADLFIIADHSMIRRILLNLLSNAIKFTPAGGQIVVGARAVEGHESNEGWTEIYVNDTGIGMSEDDMIVAMQRFGQVDTAFTRQVGGTGLGLPIVCGLAELHGGKFIIESVPGKGTCAGIRLPTIG